ncbi:MAG: response regulator [Desulfobacterales bacterium]|nr:response regulator [Desulfobacterales bacterium]
MSERFIRKLFRLFNAVVLRHTQDGCFEAAAPLPNWFCELLPEAAEPGASIALADCFPFLHDFIPEAQAHWACRCADRLRSGIWLESIPDGQEVALGASALYLLGQPIVMIESPQFSYNELYATIQTGRELALTHHSLSQTETAVRQDRDVLSLRLEERNAELEAANQKLRESEARFRLLFEQLFDAQIMFTAQGRVEDANQAACRLFNMPREGLRQAAMGDLLAPAEAERLAGLLHRLPEGELEFIGEIQVRQQGGTPVPVEAGGVTLSIGSQRFGLVSFRDITERKHLETQLQQAQKMEAIGTLAGGIAHDFNNILAAILGYSELALLDIGEANPAHMNLQEAIKASHRGKDLVKRILAFSRQDEQRKKALNISDVVNETLKMVRALIPASIELQAQIDTQTGTVEADPTQIHQVILNLCTNAAHAIGETGGGLVTVGLDQRDLSEAPERVHSELAPGAYACLTVTDSGVGIPADLLGKIFEPYFTTKDSGQGTGIGLAVAHGIIKNHGGVVTAASQVGEGSTFRVFLPIAQGPAQRETRDCPEKPTGSERILLVDDEKALQDIGRQMLQHLGYRVVAVGGSLEALALFRQSPEAFDLVITDMTMPHMTGEELARQLLSIRANLPIILCTGYSEKVTPENARQIGIRDYLLKPLTLDQLAATVRRALDESCRP